MPGRVSNSRANMDNRNKGKGGASKRKTTRKTPASKKKQGYKDRKDESIAMRRRKKRTKKELKDSRDESYGRWGSKAKKRGKINR
jgi:hypothetical protein